MYTYMASSTDFERFHEQWFEAGKSLLQELHVVVKQQSSDEYDLVRLVGRCRELYAGYAKRRVKAIGEDASYVISSCWRSPLEVSFLWMGGWRPTMSVILVFSLMGMQIEDELPKILEGVHVPTMAALSVKQLEKLSRLQQRNRVAEDELSGRLAELQVSIADQEMTKATSASPPPSESDDLSLLRLAMEPKLLFLHDIVLEAEELRSNTVESLLEILSPLQSLQFIVTAMEISIAVRKLGVAAAASQVQSLIGSASDGNALNLQKALHVGHDPSASDSEGRTPLHMAASKGHTECVDLLITAGADLNKKDNFGMTPLLVALRAGHDGTADLLTERGAETKLEEPGVELCKATASGDVKYVERLVKHGVDPSASDYAMNTPLHIAAAVGSPEAVALLVSEGADVLAKDRHGYTPLDEAREAESEAAVKIIQEEIARREESENSSSPTPTADETMDICWTNQGP